MFWKVRALCAMALAFLLWSAPLSLMSPSFAQVEDERYNPICEAGQECGRSGGSIAMMGILGVVLTFIIHKNWLAYQENRAGGEPIGSSTEETTVTSGGGQTTINIDQGGGIVPAEDEPMLGGGSTQGATIAEGYGPTKTRECLNPTPDGDCMPPGGTSINIQNETMTACGGACSSKSPKNFRKYKLKTFRLVVYDEQMKPLDDGISLSDDPERMSARLDGLVRTGMINQAMADSILEQVNLFLDDSRPHLTDSEMRAHLRVLAACDFPRCYCKFNETPTGVIEGEVLTGRRTLRNYHPGDNLGSTRTFSLKFEYEVTADMTIYSGTCEVYDAG